MSLHVCPYVLCFVDLVTCRKRKSGDIERRCKGLEAVQLHVQDAMVRGGVKENKKKS